VNDSGGEVHAAASAAFNRGDFRTVQRLGLQLYEDAKARRDHLTMARAQNLLGNANMHMGADSAITERHYRAAREQYRLAGDRRGEAVTELNLGSLALNVDLDLGRARIAYERCLTVFEELEDELSVAITLANLAEIYRLEGDYVTAFEFGKRSLASFSSSGDTPRAGWQMVNIAHDHLLKGDSAAAIQTLREAFKILCLEPNPERLSVYFETWFYVACELHAYEIAGRLLGFLEEYRERNYVPRLALLMPWFTPRVEKLQRHFSHEQLLQLRTIGAALSLEEAEAATHAIAAPP
jgi:tetratricopeptide (TPR) repeat protein